MDYISTDNPQAAIDQDELFEERTQALLTRPDLYRPGRKRGTREMVVEPFIVIYRVRKGAIEILRIKHHAQQWP